MDDGCGMLEVEEDRVSVLGSQWIDPIADVAWSWLQYSEKRPDVRHLTPSDFGRGHAIILLLAIMLESYTQRAMSDSELGDSLRTEQFKVADWWNGSVYANRESVLDVVAVRNILAHNHLYSYPDVALGNDSAEFRLISKLSQPFKDRISGNRFRVTGIPCVPDLIDPEYVKKVSVVVCEALVFLQRSGARIGPVLFKMPRGGKIQSLWEWIAVAADAATRRVALAST